MKKIMLTPVIRPRSSSGVSSCRIMLRITVLTVSAAPTAARQSSVSQKVCDSPKTTVAAPYAATDQSSTAPRRSIRSIAYAITRPVTAAPTDGAA